jgi:peptide/nickel transport system ATP-binding protein
MSVLAIEGLRLAIGDTPILRGVDLAVERNCVHGLVGESGAGKTMVGKAIVNALPEAARITAGAIRFDGRDLIAMSGRARRRLMGRAIAMILQNPMTALNPVIRIGDQMADILAYHLEVSRRSAAARAAATLAAVHIRDPERVMRLYPHELSGGMCQRVVIALAFACEPRLIVADEPTTALDVTVQYRVLRLLKEMQTRTQSAVLFITHDLGVVAKLCDEVSVMFAGRIVESSTVADLFAHPRHDYTAALLAATPRYDRPASTLTPIPEALRARLLQEAERV